MVEKLTFDENEELYELLRYFGHQDILDAAEAMFADESVPLENHWDSLEEFSVCYMVLWRFARQKEEDIFVGHLENSKLDTSILMSAEERMVAENSGLNIVEEAPLIYAFLLSMKNKFEWDLQRIEAGLFYPMVL